MRTFTFFLTALCLLATLLTAIPSGYWWVRIFDFTRLQVSILCLVAIGLTLFFRPRHNWILAGLLLIAFVYQASFVIDYTPLTPVQAHAANLGQSVGQFRILVYNIRQENRREGAFLDLVRQTKPDLLLVNETDDWWAEQLKPLHKDFPHRVGRPLGNTYGMMLYSKLPLVESQVRFLVEQDIPSIWTAVRLPSGHTFDLYCLHPPPPKPGTRSYERDAELLLVGRHIRQQGRPALVTGDLNDVGWSRTSRLFQRYSGLVDPRRGRGLYNTYSTHIPLFRYPLDHMFYSNDFGLVQLKRLPDIGSDHFPILVDLSFEPKDYHTPNVPQPQEGDSKKVREKLEEGLSQ
ncbi:endonuclease/exonuclease/phosphatase family protein [Fibrella aquatica]|uniref:endonuclease/exonuclease/phosphatase family protein n=1 Tax=Fibrella aquatica TaxID=3242487 RepID=UPI003521C1F4